MLSWCNANAVFYKLCIWIIKLDIRRDLKDVFSWTIMKSPNPFLSIPFAQKEIAVNRHLISSEIKTIHKKRDELYEKVPQKCEILLHVLLNKLMVECNLLTCVCVLFYDIFFF